MDFRSTLLQTLILLFPYLTLSLSQDDDHTIILESPVVTNRGEWGDLVNCSKNENGSSTFVIGFQLRVDYKDPFNPDNTALNGIWFGCGGRSMHAPADGQGRNLEWITSATAPYGQFQRRLFCQGGSHAMGFQLKSQPDQGPYGDNVGAVNLNMLCEDDELVEGYDENENNYPDAEYSETMKCPKGMVVCGLQTQVEDNEWKRDDNTALNNLRIQCCRLPTETPVQTKVVSITTTVEPEDDVATILPDAVVAVVNRQQLVKLFEKVEGIGKNVSYPISGGECNPVPDAWQDRVGSLEYKAECIRVWETKECSGRSRCHCHLGWLPLDHSFSMSRESTWYRNVRGLGMCEVENESFSSVRLFSEVESSEYVILQPQECLTFYEGDKWRGKLENVILVDGCVQFFDAEECSGRRIQSSLTLDASGTPMGGINIISLRNCASDNVTISD